MKKHLKYFATGLFLIAFVLLIVGIIYAIITYWGIVSKCVLFAFGMLIIYVIGKHVYKEVYEDNPQ